MHQSPAGSPLKGLTQREFIQANERKTKENRYASRRGKELRGWNFHRFHHLQCGIKIDLRLE